MKKKSKVKSKRPIIPALEFESQKMVSAVILGDFFADYLGFIVDVVDRHAPRAAAKKIIEEIWRGVPPETNLDALSITDFGNEAGLRLLRDKYGLWKWNERRQMPDFSAPHGSWNR